MSMSGNRIIPLVAHVKFFASIGQMFTDRALGRKAASKRNNDVGLQPTDNWLMSITRGFTPGWYESGLWPGGCHVGQAILAETDVHGFIMGLFDWYL
jgi:hypothetical protein